MKPFKSCIHLIVPVFAMLLIVSCSKNRNKAHLTVKMTDQPGDFDTVNVEVLEVQLHYSDDDGDGGWTVLETEAGNYDLLLLQDGLTAILAEDEEVPIGKLGQMRVILGSNNYVIVGGEYHPLELSSQDKTGLKFNLNATVAEDDHIEITFDFDAHESIILTGAGTYKLKPVLKVEDIIYL